MLYPERFGGIISLNGNMPRRGGPLLRLQAVRNLRVLIGHGIANALVPLGMAKEDYRLLYTAGLDIRLQTYPTNHRIHPDMLRDVDRWIMRRINDEHEMFRD
jgi:phospholipase/carboxylesterase